MLKQFLENIESNRLIAPGEKVLLAVSGGIDSMVLLHLFEQSGFEYGVAHCNFQLRGAESDVDEDFVRDYLQMHGIPSFFKTFDTEEHARVSGISIEMAARELRYEFFETIRHENSFSLIATAHHRDDLIETFFLNLSRKTGIKGLTGIKEKNGNIIRPLLFAGREEIEKYADENYIEYREDSTNNEVVYQRNFLRNRILPLFDELNPAFRKNLLASIDNLREAEKVYSVSLSEEMKRVMKQSGDGLEINIEELNTTAFSHLLLLEALSPLGFNPAVVGEVFQSLDAESGRQFFSSTHRLIKDRDFLFVSPLTADDQRIFYIEEEDLELFQPLDIRISTHDAATFGIIRDAKVACIDLDTVQFPLLIRKWKQGDYFQPLGMTGMKKVSDFFIDQKLPLHEKENTWLLCSGKKIVWIMGQRLDDRFKVKAETKRILKLSIG